MFHKWIFKLTPAVRDILKILWKKRQNYSLGAIFPLFHHILLPVIRFPCLNVGHVFASSKRLFEISEVEITRVDCTWTVSSENVHSNMRRMCRFRSSCACTKCHPGLCSPFMHSVASNETLSGQGRSWSDCADAQSDLGLRCPHMPKTRFRMTLPIWYW